MDRLIGVLSLSIVACLIGYTGGHYVGSTTPLWHGERPIPSVTPVAVPEWHEAVHVDSRGTFWVQKDELSLSACCSCHGERWTQAGKQNNGYAMAYVDAKGNFFNEKPK